MPIDILPRRNFLRSITAGAAALALGNRTHAAKLENTWYALVSDTHIAADLASKVRGEVMAENLRAVVADILGQGAAPAGVVIDGDLALLDGQGGDYRTLVGLLEPIRAAGVPLHLGLGNHDDRAQFREVLKTATPKDSKVAEKQVSVIEGPDVRLVVLDSLDGVNVTPGRLGAGQLEWLAQTLDASARPTLVFVHHNLSKESPNALTDTTALLDVLQPRKAVKAVFFGHTHAWSVADHEGLHWVNLPAVAYPFEAGQPLGWCRFRAVDGGGEIELRTVGGDQKDNGKKVALRWR